MISLSTINAYIMIYLSGEVCTVERPDSSGTVLPCPTGSGCVGCAAHALIRDESATFPLQPAPVFTLEIAVLHS